MLMSMPASLLRTAAVLFLGAFILDVLILCGAPAAMALSAASSAGPHHRQHGSKNNMIGVGRDAGAAGAGDGFTRRRYFEGMAAAAATGGSLWLPADRAEAAEIPAPSWRPPVPTAQLGSLQISRTIQGYWQLAGGHGRYSEADAIANMGAHFQAGITTLDTADIYGPSETIIGKFVKTQPKAVALTKLCCFRFLDEITRDEIRQRVLRAMERLQVPKLPLVQFFWSNYEIKKYVDVALYLTELREEGLIQEIGATNFDLKRLQELKRADVPIVSHQVQLSALDRRPIQSGMADWCADNDVKLIGFGTVGSGILSNKWLGRGEPTQEDKKTASLRMYTSTASRFGEWTLVQELLRTMNEIAKEVRNDGRCEQANISNIAQRYVLETPAVASLLIGVRNQAHIDENVRTHSFALTIGEREAIDAVVKKRRGPEGDVWDIERGVLRSNIEKNR